MNIFEATQKGDIKTLRDLVENQGVDVNTRDKSGQTPLHYAVKHQQAAVVKYLLSRKNIQINAKDNWQCTPLHEAISNLTILKILVEEGKADVNIQDNFGQTTLMRSISYNYLVFNYLLTRPNADINTKDKHGRSLLHMAASHSYPALRSLILLGKQKKSLEINLKDNEDNTPLHEVCRYNNVSQRQYRRIRCLIEFGAEVNIVNNHDQLPIHLLAKHKGDGLISMQYLVEKAGANINKVDENGQTPAFTAALTGNLNQLQYLVEKGARTDIKDNSGNTMLHVCSRNLDIVRYLVEIAKLDVNALNESKRTPYQQAMSKASSYYGGTDVVYYLREIGKGDTRGNNGKTELHNAVYTRQLDKVISLIKEKRMNVNKPDIAGIRAIHEAVRYGCKEILEYFINDGGADIRLTDNTDATLYHYAAYYGQVGITKYLLETLKPTQLAINTHDFLGKTPLHYAAQRGNGDIVDLLVKQDPNKIDEKDKEGHTALYLAVSHGQLEVVKCLIKAGADKLVSKLVSGNRDILLHIACSKGHLFVLKYLIEIEKMDITLLDNSGSSLLDQTAKHGQLPILKYLIEDEKGPKINVDTHTRSAGRSHTAITLAAGNGHFDVVKYLLEKGKAKLQFPHEDGPLHYAIRYINWDRHLKNVKYDIINYLLENNANKDAKGDNGTLPLLYAIISKDLKIVKCLIKAKANTNITTVYGDSLLYYAAKKNSLAIVKYLVENGLNIKERNSNNENILHVVLRNFNFYKNYEYYDIIDYLVNPKLGGVDVNAKDNNGRTPLFAVVEKKYVGDLRIVECLIANKADFNVKDNFGRTVLHEASRSNQLSVVIYLVEQQKMDPQQKDNNGKSPLDEAVSNGSTLVANYLAKRQEKQFESMSLFQAARGGHLAMVKHFIEAEEIDVNVTKDGITALYEAANHGHLGVVEYLVLKKANLEAKDNAGHTPAHKAAQQGHPKVLKFLIDNGANINAKDKKGHTLWHEVVSYRDPNLEILNHLEVMRYLLAEGLDVNIRDKAGFTPLLKAASHSWSYTRYLIDTANADITIRDNKGRSVLHQAVTGKAGNVVLYLTEKKHIPVNITDYDGNTPMHEAAKLEIGPPFLRRFQTNWYHHCLMYKKEKPNLEGKPRGYYLYRVNDIVYALVIHHSKNLNETLNLTEILKNLGKEKLLSTIQWPKHITQQEYKIVVLDKDLEREIISNLKSTNSTIFFPRNNAGETPLHIAAYHGHYASVERMIKWLQQVLQQTKVIGIVDKKGKTALHTAAAQGQLAVLKYLIGQINPDSKFLISLLQQAINSNQLDVAKYLCEFIIKELNTKGKDGQSILHLIASCQSGESYRQIMKYLVKEVGININSKDSNGQTPLHQLASLGLLDQIQFLLETLGADDTIEDHFGLTPLHLAAKKEKIAVINYLLDKGKIKINFKSRHDSKTLLHIAAGYATQKTIKLLIEKGAEINAQDKHDRTPLFDAVTEGQYGNVQYLIGKQNADASIPDENGRTLLHEASGKGHIKIVKYLISININENKKEEYVNKLDNAGNAPLHEATKFSKVTVMEYLVNKAKADLFVKNTLGETVFYCATQYGKLLKILKKFKVDKKDYKKTLFTAININGKTLVHTAAAYGRFEILKHLVSDAVNLEAKAKDNNGQTPLHDAASNGYADIVKYLIEKHKANIIEEDTNGDSPLELAALNGHMTIVHDYFKLMSPKRFILFVGALIPLPLLDAFIKLKIDSVIKIASYNKKSLAAVLNNHLDLTKLKTTNFLKKAFKSYKKTIIVVFNSQFKKRDYLLNKTILNSIKQFLAIKNTEATSATKILEIACNLWINTAKLTVENWKIPYKLYDFDIDNSVISEKSYLKHLLYTVNFSYDENAIVMYVNKASHVHKYTATNIEDAIRILHTNSRETGHLFDNVQPQDYKIWLAKQINASSIYFSKSIYDIKNASEWRKGITTAYKGKKPNDKSNEKKAEALLTNSSEYSAFASENIETFSSKPGYRFSQDNAEKYTKNLQTSFSALVTLYDGVLNAIKSTKHSFLKEDTNGISDALIELNKVSLSIDSMSSIMYQNMYEIEPDFGRGKNYVSIGQTLFTRNGNEFFLNVENIYRKIKSNQFHYPAYKEWLDLADSMIYSHFDANHVFAIEHLLKYSLNLSGSDKIFHSTDFYSNTPRFPLKWTFEEKLKAVFHNIAHYSYNIDYVGINGLSPYTFIWERIGQNYNSFPHSIFNDYCNMLYYLPYLQLYLLPILHAKQEIAEKNFGNALIWLSILIDQDTSQLNSGDKYKFILPFPLLEREKAIVKNLLVKAMLGLAEQLFRENTSESIQHAKELFVKVIELFPNYNPARDAHKRLANSIIKFAIDIDIPITLKRSIDAILTQKLYRLLDDQKIENWENKFSSDSYNRDKKIKILDDFMTELEENILIYQSLVATIGSLGTNIPEDNFPLALESQLSKFKTNPPIKNPLEYPYLKKCILKLMSDKPENIADTLRKKVSTSRGKIILIFKNDKEQITLGFSADGGYKTALLKNDHEKIIRGLIANNKQNSSISIYGKKITQISKTIVSLGGHAPDTASLTGHPYPDSYIVDAVLRSLKYLKYIEEGRNYLGYRENEISPYSSGKLLQETRYLIQIAIQLEKDYLSYQENLEREDQTKLQISHGILQEQQQIKLGNLYVKRAEQNIELAKLHLTKARMVRKTIDKELEYYNSPWEVLNEFILMGSAIGQSLAVKNPAPLINYAGNLPMRLREKEHRKSMLNAQRELAIQDTRIANQNITLATTDKEIANQQISFHKFNISLGKIFLRELQKQVLGSEIYNYLQEKAQELFSSYLDMAINYAWLFERRLAFMTGTKASIIRLDYKSSHKQLSHHLGNKILMAAETLQRDLEKLQFNYNLERPINQLRISKTLSLRSEQPLMFSQFLTTGKIAFYTTADYLKLKSNDKKQLDYLGHYAYPDYFGHLNQRIDSIELRLVGLINPKQDLKITLTNSGVSIVMKEERGGMFSKFSPVLIEHPMQMVTFSRAMNQNTSRMYAFVAAKGQETPFKGLGLETSWELILDPHSNRFNLKNIYDIQLILNYTADYNKNYEIIQRERLPKTFTRTHTYSLKQNFPDAFYQLQNSTSTLNGFRDLRLITFDTHPNQLGPYEQNQQLKNIRIYIDSQTKLPALNCKITSTHWKSKNAKIGYYRSLLSNFENQFVNPRTSKKEQINGLLDYYSTDPEPPNEKRNIKKIVGGHREIEKHWSFKFFAENNGNYIKKDITGGEISVREQSYSTTVMPKTDVLYAKTNKASKCVTIKQSLSFLPNFKDINLQMKFYIIQGSAQLRWRIEDNKYLFIQFSQKDGLQLGKTDGFGKEILISDLPVPIKLDTHEWYQLEVLSLSKITAQKAKSSYVKIILDKHPIWQGLIDLESKDFYGKIAINVKSDSKVLIDDLLVQQVNRSGKIKRQLFVDTFDGTMKHSWDGLSDNNLNVPFICLAPNPSNLRLDMKRIEDIFIIYDYETQMKKVLSSKAKKSILTTSQDNNDTVNSNREPNLFPNDYEIKEAKKLESVQKSSTAEVKTSFFTNKEEPIPKEDQNLQSETTAIVDIKEGKNI